jgi:hypothetical protein
MSNRTPQPELEKLPAADTDPEVFADPVSYLRRFGIEAELVCQILALDHAA